MALVKLLEGFHVAFGGFLRQCVIGRLLGLGFCCGHAVPFDRAKRGSWLPCLFRQRVRLISTKRPKPAGRYKAPKGPGTPSQLVVMRRFSRVVALARMKVAVLRRPNSPERPNAVCNPQ